MVPTDSFPKSSSVQILGIAGLDLGRSSGNVRAVSPHWTPLRMLTCVTTLSLTLSHDEEMLSPFSWTDELHSVDQHEKTQQAPAECLPRICMLAVWHLPTWREVTRGSPVSHVVAVVGLPLYGSCCSLRPGNTTALSSWRPTREIPPRTWHQEKLCFYWELSFGVGLVYLLDTEVTLTDHIFSLFLERPGRDLHPFALRTLDIMTHILRF